jgi:hypothetical protein
MDLMKKLAKIIDLDRIKKVAGGKEIKYTDNWKSGDGQETDYYEALDMLEKSYGSAGNKSSRSDSAILLCKDGKVWKRIHLEDQSSWNKNQEFGYRIDNPGNSGYGYTTTENRDEIIQELRSW